MTTQRQREATVRQLRELLQHERLRTEYMPPLSSVEMRAIEDKLEAVSDSALRWLSRFPGISDQPLLPTAIIKIAQLPTLPVDDIATAVEWELWALSFDDLFDRPDGPVPGSRQIADECYRIAVAAPGKEPTYSVFGESFLEVKSALARHPSFARLHSSFVLGLCGLLDGIIYVAERGSGPLPPFEEYLYHATHSFWHPFLWSLPLFDDDTAIDMLASLAALADQCGRACRLSNDISTADREELEGVPNGLVIRAHELSRGTGHALPAARHEALVQLRTLLERERAQAHETASAISTASRIEQAFLRLMDLSVEAYLRKDVRDWVAALKTGNSEPTWPRTE